MTPTLSATGTARHTPTLAPGSATRDGPTYDASVNPASFDRYVYDGRRGSYRSVVSGRATALAMPPPGPTALYRTGATLGAEGGSRASDHPRGQLPAAGETVSS